MYKIIDDGLEIQVKEEIIKIIKSCFEIFILSGEKNLHNFGSYYEYFEGLVRNESQKSYSPIKRIACSIVTLSFVNYCTVNGFGDSNELDSLESLAYMILGE